jgi:4-amino-4-deoxy-L-arabinose transferase-like glycosyltransferase
MNDVETSDSVESKSKSWGTWFDIAVVTVLMAMTAVVWAWNAQLYPAFGDDEGTYVSQANAVVNGELAPYTYWYDHPPFGWVQLSFITWLPRVLGLTETSVIGGTRYAMVLAGVACIPLIYMIARRVGMYRVFAVVAVSLWAFSPLAITQGRQIYLDSIALVWLLLAFALAVSPRKHLWQYIGAGVAFGVAVLSKETTAVFGPALLWAVWQYSWAKTRVMSIVGFLASGAITLVIYPVIAVLKGELLSSEDRVSLWDALAFQFVDRAGSGSVFTEDTARRFIVEGWLYYDRWVIWGGMIAAAILLFQKATRPISIAVIMGVLPVVLMSGYLPTMYVIATLPFLAIAMAGAFDFAFKLASRVKMRPVRVLLFAAVAGAMVAGAWHIYPERDLTTREVMVKDANVEWRAARAWMGANIARDQVLMTDMTMWNDAVQDGWNPPWEIVWHNKVQLDPSFYDHFPEGTDAIDWMVVSPIMRNDIRYLGMTDVQEIIDNSTVVAEFGEYEIRKAN